MNEDLIVGLDIGTTKICVVIGERNGRGTIEITGVGIKPSTGMRKGVVVNIEATLKSIYDAVEEAELMSGREIHSCWTGIGGSHIEGINSRGVVAISSKVSGKKRESREITQEDLDRVNEAARAVAIPPDREIIQTIPQSYIVDDHRGIKNPLDMIGVRLESEVHIITCSATSAQNLIKCINRAGFEINDALLLQTFAAGNSVLTAEETDLGVALIDMGGGTTDVLVYYEGSPYSTFTLPVGGVDVTKDISTLAGVSIETAEKIKVDSACCWEPLLEDGEDIVVSGVGGRPPMTIRRSDIYSIVMPRIAEIFDIIKQKLECLNLPGPLGGGVVITGGGAALTGAVELAGEVIRMPTRLGMPIRSNKLGGLVDEYYTTAHATAIGLVLEGDKRGYPEIVERENSFRPQIKPIAVPAFLTRIKSWFKNDLF